MGYLHEIGEPTPKYVKWENRPESMVIWKENSGLENLSSCERICEKKKKSNFKLDLGGPGF